MGKRRRGISMSDEHWGQLRILALGECLSVGDLIVGRFFGGFHSGKVVRTSDGGSISGDVDLSGASGSEDEFIDDPEINEVQELAVKVKAPKQEIGGLAETVFSGEKVPRSNLIDSLADSMVVHTETAKSGVIADLKGKITSIKKSSGKPKYSEKYRLKNPQERCGGCRKAVQFCSCEV